MNAYLREIAGAEFTAKDFRTWGGTLLAVRELAAAGLPRSPGGGKRKIVSAVKAVARQLGNRPATCRKYYIHPAVVEAYSDGFLFDVRQGAERQQASQGRGLTAEEYAVLVILAKHLETHLRAA